MNKEQEKITLGMLISENLTDEFENFDLTDVQEVLSSLASTDAIDIAHAEYLQQRSLYGANLIIDLLGKLIKSVSYLESKVNSIKNKVSLDYKAPNGEKTTADMKKQAGECSPDVEKYSILLARAKGAKSVLEKKYDILIKSHHHFKDIAVGQKRTIVSKSSVEGWEG